ncbi:Ig-like domain-containing protein [Pseudomonas halotolerans]|uniref:Ig-like domain-containing protein n=1 Tax=Pseudomonas halotolerans TaxID=3143552 RepID=UPI0031D07EC8
MDIQSSALDDLFVLYPVIIPGWVNPVKPAGLADGGIPKSLYDGEPQGLLCVIDPWTELERQSWTMAAYDRADLYVNDDPTPVAGKTVYPGEEQDRIPLRIPHGQLIHGVNRLHYKVTRPGENAASSRDLHVLYHLRAPGEPAPTGLDLVIPADVVRDGVSAERAAQGVEFGFDYTNRRDYDRIRFLLGNATVEWEVTDSSMPVVKTLFTDTFQQAGDNPNTLAEFVVFDQLGNSNQSPTKRLDIHLGSALIPPTLDSVQDANEVEIPDGTTTVSTTLKLSGQASKGRRVEIFEGNDPNPVSKGEATADNVSGIWELEITVELGPRRLYAKSLYHSGNVYSNVRTLKVVKPISLDPSTMVLDGTEVFAPASYQWTQTNLHGPGNSRTRTPTDGTPPYQYVSANAQIATVGSTDGNVIGQRNGQTLITVTDAHGQVASYQVHVSNKWDIEKRDEYANGQTLWGWSAGQVPAVEPRPSFVSGLREAIIRRLPNPAQYFHPIWDSNLGIIAHGRVSGHGDWPPGDGEVALHFYNSDGSIGVTTRRASEIGIAAGWGFRPRHTLQLATDITALYSAVVKAGARSALNASQKK